MGEHLFDPGETSFISVRRGRSCSFLIEDHVEVDGDSWERLLETDCTEERNGTDPDPPHSPGSTATCSSISSDTDINWEDVGFISESPSSSDGTLASHNDLDGSGIAADDNDRTCDGDPMSLSKVSIPASSCPVSSSVVPTSPHVAQSVDEIKRRSLALIMTADLCSRHHAEARLPADQPICEEEREDEMLLQLKETAKLSRSTSLPPSSHTAHYPAPPRKPQLSRAASTGGSHRRRVGWTLDEHGHGLGCAAADVVVKLLLVGDSGVGKTSLMLRCCEGRCPPLPTPSTGVDFRSRHPSFQSSAPELSNLTTQIWDTAGRRESTADIIRQYYRRAHGVVLCFSLTSRASLLSALALLEEVRAHAGRGCAVLLLGNKADLPSEQQQVSVKEARGVAEAAGVMFRSGSAYSGAGVETAFDAITRAVLRRHHQQQQGGGGEGGQGGGQSDKEHGGGVMSPPVVVPVELERPRARSVMGGGGGGGVRREGKTGFNHMCCIS